jgi:hypothetical protein
MGAYHVELFEKARLRHVERVEIDPRKENTELTISVSGNRQNERE